MVQETKDGVLVALAWPDSSQVNSFTEVDMRM